MVSPATRRGERSDRGGGDRRGGRGGTRTRPRPATTRRRQRRLQRTGRPHPPHRQSGQGRTQTPIQRPGSNRRRPGSRWRWHGKGSGHSRRGAKRYGGGAAEHHQHPHQGQHDPSRNLGEKRRLYRHHQTGAPGYRSDRGRRDARPCSNWAACRMWWASPSGPAIRSTSSKPLWKR